LGHPSAIEQATQLQVPPARPITWWHKGSWLEVQYL